MSWTIRIVAIRNSHQRHDDKNTPLRLAAILDDAAEHDAVSRRQLGAEIGDGAVKLLDDGGRLDAGHDVGLHRDRRQALPAPDQWRLERVGERCDLRQRDIASARRIKRQIAQRLQLGAFLREGAGDDVYQVGVVAKLRDLGAGQDRIDVVGKLLRDDAECASAVLIDIDPDHLGRLVPVVIDIARVGILAEQLGKALRIFPRLCRDRDR